MKELEVDLKWPFRLEKEFTTAWLRALKNRWYFAHKLSDGSISSKPYDCIIRTKEATYHTEIKVIDKQNFYLKQLRPNQRQALRKITKLWWIWLIVVYSKFYNKHKLFTFDKIKDIKPWDYVKLLFDK